MVIPVVFWLVALPLLWTLVAWNSISSMERQGLTVVITPQFYVREGTSCVGALLMVWFVGWWQKVLPPALNLKTVLNQFAGLFLFTIGHFVIYTALRTALYPLLFETAYEWQGGLYWNLKNELLRDIGPYFGVAAIIYGYRRNQSKRNNNPENEADSAHARLRVTTGRGEAVLDVDQIAYLEADRNYVSIYSNGREFMVRETLSSLLARLDRQIFERCHRSFVVNMNHVDEVQTSESGTAKVVLRGVEQAIPVSRGYRGAFLDRFRDRAL